MSDEDSDTNNLGPSNSLSSSSDPMMTLPTTKTNALMNRLHAFLPKIKEANQALLNPESEKMTTRVDLQLESDDSNSDDSDNDEDDEEENDDDDDDDEAENRIEEVVDEEERDTVGEGVASMAKGNNVTTNPSSSSSSAALPAIQIQFAIGHMKDDSIIKLLSGKDSDSDGNERDDKDDDDYGSVNEGNAKKRAIENLLLSSNSGGKEESTSKKTKQWVTELS